MTAVAVDLTPVVDALIERPFDRPTLDKVYASVEGHPHAYATALRCAAKRTEDAVAAAYWLVEAARVHELEDDLGGAIALLSRARDCDPGNLRTGELLAACMTRLALRAGLDFSFASTGGSRRVNANETPQRPQDSWAPPPRESGLRPPPPEHHRDTLPDLFGIDGEVSRARVEPLAVVSIAVPPAPALEKTVPVIEGKRPDPEMTNPEAAPAVIERSSPDLEVTNPVASPAPLESNPAVFELKAAPKSRKAKSLVFKRTGAASKRAAPIRPPVDPEAPRSTLVPSAPEGEPVLRAIADIAMATRRSSELPPRSERPESAVVSDARGSRSSPPPPVTVAPATVRPRLTAPAQAADDVYGDPAMRATERPVGERLVGELFEALHGFHFLDDVREGAAFLGRVLEEKMRPGTVLVHVYDINSGHFVVMSASGSRTAALVDYATREDEPFVVEIMNEDEATLVLQPGDDPRLSRGRWLLVEPRTSVLCAPCAIEGRYLGLVELIDPLDGSEFDEDDRNALTYAASAFAKFLDRRGIVLSEDEPPAETSVSPQQSAPGF